MWKITDDNGTIHSGNGDETQFAFGVMCDNDAYSVDKIEKWACG